jgi:hypothetical protein
MHACITYYISNAYMYVSMHSLYVHVHLRCRVFVISVYKHSYTHEVCISACMHDVRRKLHSTLIVPNPRCA